MGSSGMKRKNRRHLAKVGTPADLAWQRHEGMEHIEHPMADDPSATRGLWMKLVAVLVILALVGSLVGWLVFTA